MEQVAEQAGDITGEVFQHFFVQCRTSHALMDHMDKYMLGRMLDQVLLLLMEPGDAELESYLNFETKAHATYGVEQHMYETLMNSVRDVVRNDLNGDYDAEISAAFDERIEYLLQKIDTVAD